MKLLKYLKSVYLFISHTTSNLLWHLKYNNFKTGVISALIFLIFSIVGSIIAYENVVLSKEQKKINDRITDLNNEIKIANAEYMHLIAPNNLKELNEKFTPNYKDILEEQKLYLKDK